MGVDLVPLKTVSLKDASDMQDNVHLTLFDKKRVDGSILSTINLANPGDYLSLFRDVKSNGDEAVVLCSSSCLSSSTDAAASAKEDIDYEHIHVLDAHQAIIGLRMLVEYAVRLRNTGLSAESISERIKLIRNDIVLCCMMDSSDIMHIGKQIPNSIRAVSDFLQLRFVLALQSNELKVIHKAHGNAAGIHAIHQQMETDHLEHDAPVYFGYFSDRKAGSALMLETMDRFSLSHIQLHPICGLYNNLSESSGVAVAYLKQKQSHLTDFQV